MSKPKNQTRKNKKPVNNKTMKDKPFSKDKNHLLTEDF